MVVTETRIGIDLSALSLESLKKISNTEVNVLPEALRIDADMLHEFRQEGYEPAVDPLALSQEWTIVVSRGVSDKVAQIIG